MLFRGGVGGCYNESLRKQGITVETRWEQSSHPSQEYVRVDGVYVIDTPYGKFKIMAYFTIKKTLKKPIAARSGQDT